jgi:hypothetical protein
MNRPSPLGRSAPSADPGAILPGACGRGTNTPRGWAQGSRIESLRESIVATLVLPGMPRKLPRVVDFRSAVPRGARPACRIDRAAVAILAVAYLVAACSGTSSTPSLASALLASAPSTSASPSVSPTVSPITGSTEPRLEGKWTVSRKYTVVEHMTEVKVGQRETRIYTITPQCPTGPCDLSIVSFNTLSKNSTTIALPYSDGIYQYGPVSTKNPPDEYYCVIRGKNYTDATQTYTLTIKVTKTAPTVANGAPVPTEIKVDGDFTLVWSKAATKAGCNPGREVTSGTGVPG